MHIGLVARGDIAYTLDLANLLYRFGMQVTLYLSYAHTARETGDHDHPIEKLYALELLPRECQVRLTRPPRMRNPFSLFVYLRLARTIRGDGVDVVHILAGPHELWLAILSCLIREIPVVCTMIVPLPNIGSTIPVFLSTIINRFLALGSDLVIVNGKDQVPLLEGLYKVPLNQIQYIPLNARDTASKWSLRPIDEEPATILFFGAARLHKGLEYLVRSQPYISKRVPLVKIIVSAHGEDLNRCLQMIENPSGFEIHDGFASGEEMAELFQRATLVALPYLSASTSGVLMTAYSFGKPVVATNVGCLPEYVQENITGLLVPPADAERLAEAIILLLKNDTLRRKMGENAKLWIRERNKDIAFRTISAYRKVLGAYVRA